MEQLGCVVCCETIIPTNKAVVKGCCHEFCVACIKSWTRTNLSCPLCKQEFTVLQHSFAEDGSCTEEQLVNPTVTPVAVEEQLNCLDHSFFLPEVTRLLQAAERVHKQLWLEDLSGRGLSVVEKRHLCVVEAVCLELRNHKRRLQALLHFDPHIVLQDLYRLQSMLDTVWLSPYDQQASQPHPVRYSADDAWEGNVPDEDDELQEEMAYLAIAKSKQTHKGKVSKVNVPKPTTNKNQQTKSQTQKSRT